MTDRDALLAAIIAQPAEDVPRLAFADWLTENGQPERGEVIRLGCELAASFGRLGDVRYTAIQRRLEELLRNHGNGWVSELVHAIAGPDFQFCRWDAWGAGYHSTRHVQWKWRRGFIDDLVLSAADWLAHADAITAAHPVQAVTLTTRPRPVLRDTSFTVRCRSDGGFVEQPPQRPFGWSLTATSAVRYLDAAGRHVDIDWPGHPNYDPNFVIELLRAEWPAVKTWHLPPEPGPNPFRGALGVWHNFQAVRRVLRAGGFTVS